MTELTQPEWMKGYVPDHTSTRWQKGQSGNPAGRPKGSLNRTDKIARALNEEGLEVVRVVLDAAKAGDMVACGHVLTLAVAQRSGSATARGLANRASLRKPTDAKPSGPAVSGDSLPFATVNALAAWVAGAFC